MGEMAKGPHGGGGEAKTTKQKRAQTKKGVKGEEGRGAWVRGGEGGIWRGG